MVLDIWEACFVNRGLELGLQECEVGGKLGDVKSSLG